MKHQIFDFWLVEHIGVFLFLGITIKGLSCKTVDF